MAGTQGLGVVNPNDLTATARELAESFGGPAPRQTNLRRAISTAYYAMFHCLAENCADMLVGEVGSGRSEPAWQQAYRALQHGAIRSRCNNTGMIERFPAPIREFAERLVRLQTLRERADYDPMETLEQSDVIRDIEIAERRIAQFRQAPERDRRAFAVYVLLNIRNT